MRDEENLNEGASAERTYSCSGFGIEDLLHEGYAVRSGLAAPCAGAGEDVVVFERERDRLLLDKGGARKTEILQRAEDERGDEVGKVCECKSLFRVNHFVPSLRSSARIWFLYSSKNHRARDMTLSRKFPIQRFKLDVSVIRAFILSCNTAIHCNNKTF